MDDQKKGAELMSRIGDMLHETWVAFMQLLHDEPIFVSVGVVIVSAVVLYLLSKVMKFAFYVVLIVAVLLGVAVFLLGPDQARSYLEDIGVLQEGSETGR